MKTMASKYPGKCGKCGGRIARGELIVWHGRGAPVDHAKCVGVAKDNSSHEDRECGDMAYEDRCAAACGL